MVVYDLLCANHHVFEGWFKSSEEFDSQNAVGMVACPICESTHISKKAAAPNIIKRQHSPKDRIAEVNLGEFDEPTSSKAKPVSSAITEPNAESVIRFSTSPEQVEVLRKFVEKNFEDVGDDFSEESRRMHYGEIPERAISGQATPEDIIELEEEGIETYIVPLKMVKKKLS